MTGYRMRAFSRFSVKRAQHDADRRPCLPSRPGHRRANQCEQRRHAEQIERRLLHEPVPEDGLWKDRQHGTGDETDARAEERSAGDREQHARRGAGERLQDPDQEHVVAGQLVQNPEEVRVQRRLVEDLGAEPLTARDLPRPSVVAFAVDYEDGEEG